MRLYVRNTYEKAMRIYEKEYLLSLFTVVMFYEVIAISELVTAEPSLIGELRGQVPTSFWSHFHQPIEIPNLSCASFCLNMPYWVHIAIQSHWDSCLREAQHFLLKAQHAWILRNSRQHFSNTLWAVFSSNITHRQHKNVKNMALNRLQKGHLFGVVWGMRAEKSRLSDTLFFKRLLGKWALKLFTSLHMSTSDCENTRVDFGVTRTF